MKSKFNFLKIITFSILFTVLTPVVVLPIVLTASDYLKKIEEISKTFNLTASQLGTKTLPTNINDINDIRKYVDNIPEPKQEVQINDKLKKRNGFKSYSNQKS